MRVLSWTLGICLVAFLTSGCNGKTPTTPTPPSETTMVYTALGASDGIGFGGTVPCLPFDPSCPGGTGYVYVLKRRLQSDGRTVTLNNRSVPGTVMSPAIQSLGQQAGRSVPGNFIEQEVPFIPGDTTHLTVFAGGNDVNVIAQAVRVGLANDDIRGYIDRQVQQWGTDFDDMIRRIRTRAANTRIIAVNLPNLAAAPYVSSNTAQERSVLQRIAVGIADRVNAARSSNVLVVDLLCEPRIYSASNFSSDGFHPNDAGYALMAELIYPALANGTAPAPSSTCPQRTLLPVF